MGPLASARHVFAVERAQRAILARVAATATPARWWHRFAARATAAAFALALPAIAVFAAWRDAAGVRSDWARPWAFAAVAAVVLGSGHLFQSRGLSFSSREVLFLPDKAGVLLARLGRRLPWFIGCGSAWALACCLHLQDLAVERPLLAAAVAAVALAAPLAWTVGRLLARLVSPGARPTLAPAVLVAFAAVYAAEPLHWAGGNELRWVELGLVLAVGGMAAAALATAWLTHAHREWRALWPELVRVPRLCVVLVLLAPTDWLHAGTSLLAIVTAGAVAIVGLLPPALHHLLRAVRGAEATTGGSVRAEAGDATAAPAARNRAPTRRHAPAHRGRSPWRAAWCLHWLQHGLCWRDLARPSRLHHSIAELVGFTVRHLAGVLMVLPALWRPDPAAAAFLLLAGLLAPSFVGAGASPRLWLWGVDLRTQARQQVLAVLLGAALPTLLAAVALVAAAGFTAANVWLPAGLAAVFLLRVGWRGLAPRGELAQVGNVLPLLVLALLVATIWVPILHWWTVLPAGALGLVGLARRIRRWREPELVAAFVATRSGSHAQAGG